MPPGLLLDVESLSLHAVRARIDIFVAGGRDVMVVSVTLFEQAEKSIEYSGE